MIGIKVDRVLDAKGLVCPMPVLGTRKMLDELKSGEVLEVITTDPASRADIPALVGRLGHELLEVGENGESSFFSGSGKGKDMDYCYPLPLF